MSNRFGCTRRRMLVRQTATLALCLILCTLGLAVLANAQGQSNPSRLPHLKPPSADGRSGSAATHRSK